MANKKTADLVDLDINRLVDALADAKKEHFNLRFQHVTGQLDDVSTIKKHRKQVARINTELRAREIAAHEELEKQRENA